MKYLRYLVFFVNVILVIALLISYMSPFISPEGSQTIPLFGLFYPYLFFFNILFFIGWLMVKWTYSLLSLAAFIVGFSANQKLISLDQSTVMKSPENIHILSYNVASGQSIRTKDREAFYDFVDLNYKDGILFLQESSSKIMETLRDNYPREFIVELQGKRATIMSHYPVLKSGILDFKDNYNVCVWADVKIGDQVVRVYSVHLQSNQITRIADDVVNNANLGDKETWGNVGTMMKRYSKSTVKRLHQTKTILDHISTVKHSVIVAGDFNDVPQSYLYTEMSEKLQDSFVQKGFGLGTSFNGSIPALRIDYIFADKRFQVLEYDTYRVKFSDHFPISATLIYRG